LKTKKSFISLKNISKVLEKPIEYLLASVVLIMFISVLLEVIVRYFFNIGIHASEEIARFMLISMVFFGASLVTYRRRHVSLRLFHNFLSDRPKKYLLVFIYLASIYTTTIFINSAWRLTIQCPSQRSPFLEIPMSWVQFTLVLSGILMVFFFFVQLLEVIINNTMPSKIIIKKKSKKVEAPRLKEETRS